MSPPNINSGLSNLTQSYPNDCTSQLLEKDSMTNINLSPTLRSFPQSPLDSCFRNSDNEHLAPICFVDGFLSSPGMNIWVDLIAHFRNSAAQRNTPCPPLHLIGSGGVASAYDTAISMFYQIKGGLEDYGEAHAASHKHERFWKEHDGIYPSWSEKNPIHVIAHSFGGNVVLLLQKLLDNQIFYDHRTGKKYLTNANWIKSCATVSSPMKGTTMTLLVGHVPGKPGQTNTLSLGRLIYSLTHIWEWLEIPSLKQIVNFDFRVSHFGLAKDRSWFKFGKRVLQFEVFDDGVDNAAYDISIERIHKAPLATKKDTFYRSYAATMTRTNFDTKYENSINHWFLPFRLTSNRLGKFDFIKQGNGHLNHFHKDQPLWRSNDGIIPLISQYHPGDCSPSTCCHFDLSLEKHNCSSTKGDGSFDMEFPTSFEEKATNSLIQPEISPGKWYVSTIPDCSHIDLIPGIVPPAPSVWKKISSYASSFMSNNYTDEISLEEWDDKKTQAYREALFKDYEQFIETVNNS